MNTTEENVKYDESWLQRYRNGKLQGEELDQFEIYLLENPDVAEQVELELIIQENLPDLEIQQHNVKQDRSANWVWGFSGLAAGVLLVVLLQFGLVREELGVSRDPSSSGQIVYLENYRSLASNDSVTEVKVSSANNQLVLVWAAGFTDEKAEQSFELLNLDTGERYNLGDISLSPDGDFVVVIPIEGLMTGDYELVKSKGLSDEKVRRLRIIKV